jgi:hypothetical protein
MISPLSGSQGCPLDKMVSGKQGGPSLAGKRAAFLFQGGKDDLPVQNPEIKPSKQDPQHIFPGGSAGMGWPIRQESTLSTGSPDTKSCRRLRESASRQKPFCQTSQIFGIQ